MIGVARAEAPCVSTSLAAVDAELGGHAPLPRANGELVFEEPWQGRALGMGVVVLERLGLPWSEFRDHLVAAIERHGHPEDETDAEAYYTAFLDAVESLVADQRLISHVWGQTQTCDCSNGAWPRFEQPTCGWRAGPLRPVSMRRCSGCCSRSPRR